MDGGPEALALSADLLLEVAEHDLALFAYERAEVARGSLCEPLALEPTLLRKVRHVLPEGRERLVEQGPASLELNANAPFAEGLDHATLGGAVCLLEALCLGKRAVGENDGILEPEF